MRGLFYANFRDACYKVTHIEGYSALYKGSFFLWARHGVVATTNMLFWDQWKDRVLINVQKKNDKAFVEQYFVQYCFDSMDMF